MVTHAHERLKGTFASALKSAGFTSWVGKDLASPTNELVEKFGAVYLHETVNSHIRRLLDTDVACRRLHEIVPQFKARVKKAEKFMNSKMFKAKKDAGKSGGA